MTSNTLPTPSSGAGDIAKYAVALLLLVGGIFAYYWFEGSWPSGVRVLAIVAGLVLAGVVFFSTAKGAQMRGFLSESRFELRKVVWPSRQDATRTMWVVIVAVILISLILAAFDWTIQSAVKALLGS